MTFPRASLAAFMLLLASLSGSACGQGASVLADSDLVVQEQKIEVDVMDAQRSVREEFQVLESLSPRGAQAMTTSSLSFQKDSQSVEILEAYTAKKDGRQLPVTERMIDRQTGVLGGNLGASFPNLSVWLLRFPDVQVGDRTVLRYRRHTTRTALPGWFSDGWLGVLPFETRALRVVLKAPASLPWHVHARGLAVQHRVEKGQDLWELEGQLPARPAQGQAVNRQFNAPGVAASTYASPQAVGEAFARAFAERTRLTQQVQVVANTIFRSQPRPADPVAAAYDWVRANIRYSASYLDFDGGWVGRDLDAVLEAGQGDCKDIAALLVALLRTQGIEAVPALVNLGDEYEFLPVGTPQFTHVLVYLPAERRFLDTTSTELFAGQLPLSLRGKPVVLAMATASGLDRIPQPTPDDQAITSTGRFMVDSQGQLSGTVTLRFEGIPAWTLHQQLARIPAAGKGSVAVRHMLSQAGLVGEGTLVSDFAPLHPRQNVSVEAIVQDFLPSGESGSLSLVPPLPLMASSLKERLTALSRIDTRGPQGICLPMRIHEEFTVTFDPEVRIDRLPKGMELDEPLVRYASRYRLEGQVLSVERDYLYRPATLVCSQAQLSASRSAWARIQREMGGAISYQRVVRP